MVVGLMKDLPAERGLAALADAVSGPCRKCGRHPQARGTGWCARCLHAEDERREAQGSLRLASRIAGAAPAAARVCAWCGAALTGYATRRTCSAAHRKALSRAGGVGPFSGANVTPSGEPMWDTLSTLPSRQWAREAPATARQAVS